ENISVAVDRLDYLDSKYDLKKVLIVESSTLDSSLSLVSEHGYHSSYYLSYKIINKLIADENITEMESYSLKISEQIVLQKVKAVSFDVSCYTFVTNYLIPKIDSNIVFHTWDLSLSLVDSNLINNIENKNYIDCKRIKTVLVKKE
ncbi:MAG: hypothetical protein KAG84_05645, partial [Bacteroidales bacterium]|nr:hypothetical protein [Bacteroidales bacterium]